MTVTNMEVSNKFNRLANLLEIEGANPFRIRAYRTAARVIAGLSKNISDLILQGEDLTGLPGVGKDLAEKIKTIVSTEHFPLLEEVELRIPTILNELMEIEGLGAKRIQILYKKLQIKTVKDLKNAITKGKLREIKGFGEKMEQKILQSIERGIEQKRMLWTDVTSTVNALTLYLKKLKHVTHVDCAGSYRRCKETIGDLDFVLTVKKKFLTPQYASEIINSFIHYPEVASIISQGTTRSAVRLHSGVQVDLRVVPEESYGAALLYFTGSKDHNIAVRKIAVHQKLKINEYGVFKGKKMIAGKTEEDIYRSIGLPFIAPELREFRGELEAARQNQLPTLIQLRDIRGDFHCHSTWGDGHASIEEIIKACQIKRYDYVAIADRFTRKFDKQHLMQQIKMIDHLNAKLDRFVVLKALEVDILENGELGAPDEVLKEMDLTICAINSHFDLPEKKQTERILRAMDHSFFNILSHPTGRLLNQPYAYTVNTEKIMLAAKERHCILELNAQPHRLDLSDVDCKLAKELGIKIAIATDARTIDDLDAMSFGIQQARRGWLQKENVINTLPLIQLRKILKRGI